ncbi:MAG: nucleotidyltransferase domain-containing protein [Methanomassiliicoccaceae archaeon]|nr:nucleotidyltransferase domain-containing protein [Methanomassiliicoccaceae archaeon]
MSLPNGRKHTIEEIRLIVAPIAERYGVGKVYLFGSVARGDHNEKSDYDFCIELGKIKSIFKMAGFFGALKDAIGYDIDLVDTESVPPEFLKNIINDGIVVYGE